MTDRMKNKRVLVKVKDLDEKQLDIAIDEALDALFGKDEDVKVVPPGKDVSAGKKPSKNKPGDGK